jgi:chromosome segregation ATPase
MVIAERVSEVVNKKIMELDKKYGERIEALERRISLLEAEIAAVRTGFVKDLVKSIIDTRVEDAVISTVKSMGGALLSELDARVKTVNESLAQLNKGVNELRESLSAVRSDLEKSMDDVAVSVRKSLDSLQASINNLVVAVNELRETLKKLSETLHNVDLKVSGVFERVEDINATVKDMMARLETPALSRSPSEEGAG